MYLGGRSITGRLTAALFVFVKLKVKEINIGQSARFAMSCGIK